MITTNQDKQQQFKESTAGVSQRQKPGIPSCSLPYWSARQHNVIFSRWLGAICQCCNTARFTVLFQEVTKATPIDLARQNQTDGLSNHRHLHLSHSWWPASSGPRGARVQPRCQTRCYRWSWTPPCLPYLHADKGRVRKQRKGIGDDRKRVGEGVRSIVIQRGTKTADRAFSIFDDKPKNKRRWKEEDT